MITSHELRWLAGLLEGEGCFHSSASSTCIVIKMTDLDIIEKFRIITKTTHLKVTVIPGTDRWKTRYSTSISGNLAIQWMMTLYLLMGIRRKAKIKDIIEKWKVNYYREESNTRRRKYYTNEYQSVKAIAMARKISVEEARKVLETIIGKTIQ